ncbi:hypothetical protein NLA06_09940 [Desulfomicrobium sp. ZS1]|nr:hypothetical protein [Desulfomicrobium sp. ZS1]UTF51931.1 hypothetical protein NLA06_09940 [Desulfomicrobium sp. ZS1]
MDDPYIPPANPEVTIDTTEKIPVEAAQIIFRCRLTRECASHWTIIGKVDPIRR